MKVRIRTPGIVGVLVGVGVLACGEQPVTEPAELATDTLPAVISVVGEYRLVAANGDGPRPEFEDGWFFLIERPCFNSTGAESTFVSTDPLVLRADSSFWVSVQTYKRCHYSEEGLIVTASSPLDVLGTFRALRALGDTLSFTTWTTERLPLFHTGKVTAVNTDSSQATTIETFFEGTVDFAMTWQRQ